MTARVVLVDDQRVVRDGLSLILGLLPDIELLGVAEDGERAVALAAEQRPDVVLMDLRMPRMDGVEATRRIRTELPEVQVIVLTTYADDDSVFAALQAGARGYLTKDAGADEIAEAVARVHGGQAMLDPAVQARLLDRLAGGSSRAGPHPGRGSFPDRLTAREAEVLRLVARGLSNSEIAQHLVVSEATVKTHINRLFAKTGVRDRAQVVAYAYRHRIAHP